MCPEPALLDGSWSSETLGLRGDSTLCDVSARAPSRFTTLSRVTGGTGAQGSSAAERLERAVEATARLTALTRASTYEEVTAFDQSGAVEVAVDTAGQTIGARVADDWLRRIDPARLASAVIEAAGRAGERLSAALARAVIGSEGDPSAAWSAVPDAKSEPAPDPSGSPRDVAEIAESAIAFLTPLTQGRWEQPHQEARGMSGPHVAVTVSATAGLTGCVIDPDWCAHQPGLSLSMHLDRALSQARSQLAPSPSGQGCNGLAVEALAYLTGVANATDDVEGVRTR